MADTYQIVSWTLERSCKLRDSEESMTDTGSAQNSVAIFRAYSKTLRKERGPAGIFGDIYVTVYTHGDRPGKKKARDAPYYPSDGFSISKQFEPYGGPRELMQMCSDCPASVDPDLIGTCVGSLMQWPDSKELEAQLAGIIDRFGLAQAMTDAFPRTKPTWYGLWAVSPVPRGSLGVLRVLIHEMLIEDRASMEARGEIDREQIEAFSAFISAIDIAEQSNLNLHVRLSPPGHLDFGWYTVFPHCPFCKARAPLPAWQRNYPVEHHVCRVCGTKFSPAETSTSERMNFEPEHLRDTLGQKAFEDFAQAYLIELGESPNSAAEIVRETEAKVARRKQEFCEQQEKERLGQQYIQEKIYADLDCLAAPRCEYEDHEADSVYQKWFDAKTMDFLLNRFEQHGIKTTYMEHFSEDGKMDRHEMRIVKPPKEILARWVAEGCNKKFRVYGRVPDSLIS